MVHKAIWNNCEFPLNISEKKKKNIPLMVARQLAPYAFHPSNRYLDDAAWLRDFDLRDVDYHNTRAREREVNHVWRKKLFPFILSGVLFTTRFSSAAPRYFIRGLPRPLVAAPRCPFESKVLLRVETVEGARVLARVLGG